MRRWRGLKAIIVDAVDHGSRAVERVQLAAAKVPFSLLEAIPPLAVPAKGAHEIYDTAVSNVHGMIRLVNRVASDSIDAALDVIDEPAPKDG